MLSENKQAAELGREGEQRVAEYLRRQGYVIIKRNWRDNRYGEIDIIAESKENIVFVEVKTRDSGSLYSGAEAIDEGKINRTRNAAAMFMKRLNTELQPRFDVAEVTVYKKQEGKDIWKLKYIKSAF